MTWFVFVTAYCVLSYGTVPVAGQSAVCSCTSSVSGSDEKLQVSLKDHDQRLETMNQNMSSAFERLEEAVNRINIKGHEVLCKDLTMMYRNMSANFLGRVSEKIPEIPACQATQDQEEYLSSMNLSLTSMIVRTADRTQAVNENIINVYQSLSSTLQTVNRSLYETFQSMNGSVVGALKEHDQKLQTMNETLSSSVDKINDKLNDILNHVNENLQFSTFQDHCRNTSVVCDCSGIKANGYTASEVYRIYVVDEGQRYYANVFCDMTTTNGSWTVFQRRKDGSVDFYRGWTDYENGFGNPNREFWLGNKFLHLLTSKRRYRLRIDLEDFEGGKRVAEYSTFNIGSSADKYRLRIGTYSGHAGGDSLIYHNGQRFSTKDNDNDVLSSENCAVSNRGAWWYTGCQHSNLNGLYLRGHYSSNGTFNGLEGVRWLYWHYSWYSLKTTEMKISSS